MENIFLNGVQNIVGYVMSLLNVTNFNCVGTMGNVLKMIMVLINVYVPSHTMERFVNIVTHVLTNRVHRRVISAFRLKVKIMFVYHKTIKKNCESS